MSRSELRQLHARELDATEKSRIEQHLGECRECARLDADLVALHESWIQRIRAAGMPAPAPAPRRSVDAPPKPDLIAGYDILEELNRGGQGVVYRALQKATKRDVAIKLLREGPFASASAKRRFEREIELVAGLRHPNIMAVFDSGSTDDGRQFCVMDYVAGTRLDEHVRNEGLNLRQTLELFAVVCDAINHAHQRGVIHRDLKPSNILVDSDGRPKVLDFGLAKQSKGSVETRATTEGIVAGTLPYMSPEQIRGGVDEIDIRSDVYALGVILYELLTGDFPYPTDCEMLVVLRHIAETPPRRPSTVRRKASRTGTPTDKRSPQIGGDRIDDELETIVLKTLAKEVERRYQTAGELARDIRHYLANEPIEAKRDSGWYILTKTLQRYRALVVGAAVFAVVVTGAVVALGVMYASQSRLRAVAEAQSDLARAAEAKARQRFDQLRDLARSFIFEFDANIKHLPGTAPARQLIVEKGLAYLDGLSKEAEGDRELLLELAAAYMTIGDVQGDEAASNIGDVQGALESYRKALSILQDLGAAGQIDLPSRQTMALSYNKMGDAWARLGKSDESLEAHLAALAIARELRARYPDDDRARDTLADALERVGNMYRERGELDAALEHHRAVVEIAEARSAEAPNDRWRRRDVAVGFSKTAQIQYAQGRLPEALRSYDRFRELSEALLELEAENLVARHDVLIAYQWLGIILTELGEIEPAIENLKRSAEVGSALVRDDPDSSAAIAALATTYTKLGEAQLSAGLLDDALECFDRNVKIISASAERNPDLPLVQRLKGVAQYKMAECHTAYSKNEHASCSSRREHLEAARRWLQACLSSFVQMRERGILAASDDSVPSEIAAEIAACRAAIDALANEGTP